jgi:hypothetical protein
MAGEADGVMMLNSCSSFFVTVFVTVIHVSHHDMYTPVAGVTQSKFTQSKFYLLIMQGICILLYNIFVLSNLILCPSFAFTAV